VRDVFDRTVRTLEDGGARVAEVALPEAELVYPTFRTIQGAEALDTHRRAGLFPARRGEYRQDVLGRLDAATEITLEQFAALGNRQRVRAGFDALGIPVGVQFTAPAWHEARVLRAAHCPYEATLEVQSRWPVLPA
jgi:Asp-tRNA(Asn)/Glu-tRNA(Gln) amidotransferase A subunit family amidase